MPLQTRTAPALRLVHAERPLPATALRAVNTAEAAPVRAGHCDARAVAEENSLAAGLSALDPRWIFAVQVERAVQGGRAGLVGPEARRRLLATAEKLELRPFDANLIIAIVQDAARSRQDPLGRDVEQRLRLVKPPESARTAQTPAGIGASVLLAVALVAIALAWLTHA